MVLGVSDSRVLGQLVYYKTVLYCVSYFLGFCVVFVGIGQQCFGVYFEAVWLNINAAVPATRGHLRFRAKLSVRDR